MSPLYVSLYTIIHAFLDFVNTIIVSAVLVIYCEHISKVEFIGIVKVGIYARWNFAVAYVFQ